jgi:hypothetical protein
MGWETTEMGKGSRYAQGWCDQMPGCGDVGMTMVKKTECSNFTGVSERNGT